MYCPGKLHVQMTALLLCMQFSAFVQCADESAPASTPPAPAQASTTAKTTFDQVLPILRENCIACHNRTLAESDLSLEDPESILKGGSLGPAIDPKNPDQSLLLQLASYNEEPVMPPEDNDVRARQLTTDELALLERWIRDGAAASAESSAESLNWQAINPALVAVYALDMDWHGRFLAAGRGGKVTIYDRFLDNSHVNLVDPALNYLVPAGGVGVAHRDFVQAVAFHPDGNQLATAGFQGVKLWSRSIATLLRQSFQTEKNARLFRDSQGRLLEASSDGALRQHSSGQANPVDIFVRSGLQITAADQFSMPAARQVLGTADGQLIVLDAAGEQEGAPVTFSDSSVLEIFEHPSESLFAVRSGDRHLASYRIDENGILEQLHSSADVDCRFVGWKDSDLIVLLTAQNALATITTDGTSAVRFQMDEAVQQTVMDAATSQVAVVSVSGKTTVLGLNEFQKVCEFGTDSATQLRSEVLTHRKSTAEARVAHIKSLVAAREKELTDQKNVTTKAEEALQATQKALDDARKAATDAEAQLTVANEKLSAAPEDAAAKAEVEKATKAVTDANAAVAAAEKKHRIQEQDTSLAREAVKRFEAAVVELQTRLNAANEDVTAAIAAAASLNPTSSAPGTIAGAGFLFGGSVIAVCDAGGTVTLSRKNDGQHLEQVQLGDEQTTIKSFFTTEDNVGIAAHASGVVTFTELQPQWKLVATLGEDTTGQMIFPERVNSLAYSADGKLLAAGGGEASRSGTIAIWSTDDHSVRHVLKDIHSDVVYGLEFSPDSRLLASASADKFARILNVATGEPVRVLEGHTNQVMDVAWNAAQSTIATAGADNAIKVWTVETGLQQRTISTYRKQVSSVQFADTGAALLSCSGDQRVFLHNAGDGKPMREMPRSPDYVHTAVTDGAGKVVATGCEDGHVRLFNAGDGKLIVDLDTSAVAAN